MSNKKIVVVEDDKILSKVMTTELRDAGYKVMTAADGEAGLKLVKKELPDLVLLDLVMPKMHGFEVLKSLRQDPTTKGTPVIILSVLSEDEDIKKGLKLGANDYLVKSSHALTEVAEKVKSFLEKG